MLAQIMLINIIIIINEWMNSFSQIRIFAQTIIIVLIIIGQLHLFSN